MLPPNPCSSGAGSTPELTKIGGQGAVVAVKKQTNKQQQQKNQQQKKDTVVLEPTTWLSWRCPSLPPPGLSSRSPG